MNYTKTSWENDITPVSAENMNKIENQLKVLTDAIYPVGSIYMSMSSTNPSNLFGGTWQRIGVGRTLISAGGDSGAIVDANNYTGRGTNSASATSFPVGETGGELSHALTTTEMPSHNHTQNAHSHGAGSGWYFGLNKTLNSSSVARRHNGTQGDYYCITGKTSDLSETANTASSTPTINSSGGGGAHNIMSTYLAVYMWKRTA